MYGARPCCSALRGGIGGLGPLMFDESNRQCPMHRFGVWGTFRYGVAFLAWQLL